MDINPILTQNDDKNEAKKLEVSEFDTSSEMVAGAGNVCIWKFEKQSIKVPSEHVISWARTKIEFTRGKMEKALDLTLGQAEWWIKELRKRGIIKRTNRHEYKIGKGQRQVIYKYTGK